MKVDEKDLIRMAKEFKKRKVSLDKASFGQEDCNAEVLKKLIESVNGNGLAKKLKNEKVSLDVASFGQEDCNA